MISHCIDYILYFVYTKFCLWSKQNFPPRITCQSLIRGCVKPLQFQKMMACIHITKQKPEASLYPKLCNYQCNLSFWRGCNQSASPKECLEIVVPPLLSCSNCKHIPKVNQRFIPGDYYVNWKELLVEFPMSHAKQIKCLSKCSNWLIWDGDLVPPTDLIYFSILHFFTFLVQFHLTLTIHFQLLTGHAGPWISGES